VDQALVAATNLLGGDLAYHATMAPAQLKVPGIDLLSVGEIAPRGPDEQAVRTTDQQARRYLKLVLRGGRAIGAIVIGLPTLFDGITDAVLSGRDLSGRLEAIERGDWSMLTSDLDGVDEAALTVSRVE
jgi:NAD(P)H-nitrite reductase large subunit